MAEVIELNGRKTRDKKRRKADARRRAQAVASAMSCGICPHRCSRCGLALESGPASDLAPYPFCEPCHQEYLAYKRRENGDEHQDAFWHTAEWVQMWRTWLEYMRSTDAFRGSAAFMRLVQEPSE
jgi:hypothetical protein